MGQYYKVITRCGLEQHVYDRSVDGEYTMAKLCEHGWFRNPFCEAIAEKLTHQAMQVCWVGDYAEPKECKDLGFEYDTVWGENSGRETVHRTDFHLSSMRYLVNYDRKQVVDLKEYARRSSQDGWVLNPIAILTCLGNGRGGGDYYPSKKSTPSYVGRWAMDRIYVTNEKPEGFRMIHPVFREGNE